MACGVGGQSHKTPHFHPLHRQIPPLERPSQRAWVRLNRLRTGVGRCPGLSMGHIYLSHSRPIAIDACPIPWDSHYIFIILIWNTIQLKLLNL